MLTVQISQNKTQPARHFPLANYTVITLHSHEPAEDQTEEETCGSPLCILFLSHQVFIVEMTQTGAQRWEVTKYKYYK